MRFIRLENGSIFDDKDLENKTSAELVQYFAEEHLPVLKIADTIEDLVKKNDLCELGIIEEVAIFAGPVIKYKINGRWFDSICSLYTPRGKYNDYLCAARGCPLRPFNRQIIIDGKTIE